MIPNFLTEHDLQQCCWNGSSELESFVDAESYWMLSFCSIDLAILKFVDQPIEVRPDASVKPRVANEVLHPVVKTVDFDTENLI